MEKTNDFDAMIAEVLADSDARTAHAENALRRHLAEQFEAARQSKSMSVRGLATEMGTSISQVQRLLHHEAGGSLTLKTLCRAADVLGLAISVEARACENSEDGPRSAGWQKMPMSKLVHKQRLSIGPVVKYGHVSDADDWHESADTEVERASA